MRNEEEVQLFFVRCPWGGANGGTIAFIVAKLWGNYPKVGRKATFSMSVSILLTMSFRVNGLAFRIAYFLW